MPQCKARAYGGGQRCQAGADESGLCWRHRDRTITEADRQAELRNRAIGELLTMVRMVRRGMVDPSAAIAALDPLWPGDAP